MPVSTPGFDAAPYLTATLCITKDPDSGVQNLGTYRVALKAPDRAVVRMVAREATGAGGFLHWLKYRDRKEKMPIAVVVGAAPIVMFTGPQKLAVDMDEMGGRRRRRGRADPHGALPHRRSRRAGRLRDRGRGPDRPELLEPEAPFGESNGYVALEAYNMPMQVTAITHKTKPVFAQIISQVTPSESSVIKKVAYEPLFLAHLKTHLGVKGIRRVVMHERLTNLRPVIFLQFAAGTPRTEVWRGLNGAATLQSNCGKIVIAVSEDIDPAEHGRGAVVARLPHQSGRGHAHHAARAAACRARNTAGNKTDSGLLVDATRKRPMPPLALPTGNTWSTPARCGRSLGCRRSTCRRLGTATPSTTGPTPGRPSRAAPRRATGRRPAGRRSSASAGALARNAGAARTGEGGGVKVVVCEYATKKAR